LPRIAVPGGVPTVRSVLLTAPSISIRKGAPPLTTLRKSWKTDGAADPSMYDPFA
jgi:hypothetical protein